MRIISMVKMCERSKNANAVYLVYGSYKGGKYKAMDINEGIQVNNLIYATMFYPETLDKLKVELEKIEKDNPEWTFEVRKNG